MKSIVSIVKGKDIEAMVDEAIDLIGGIESIVKPGNVILIKPNVHGAHPLEDHITVDPRLVAAVVKKCKKAGAKEVLVGEAPSLGADTMFCFEISGMKEAVEAAGARLVDLETDEYISTKIPQGKILKSIDRPKTFINCDVVISMPVMKTHHGTKVTGSLKNMMGTLNRTGKNLVHQVGLDEAIADINKTRKPDLVVADMIVAMEGEGPIAGRTVTIQPDGSRWIRETVGGILVPMDLIVVSKDPVANDATCCRIMKINPEEVFHLQFAYEHGLGNIGVDQIEVRGKQIEEVARAFLLPPTTFEEFAEYVTVHSENACFACPAYLYMALLNLRERGLLERNSGLHIVMGTKNHIPDDWGTGKNLLLLGNCVSKWKHLGLYAEGCPPMWAFMLGVAMRDLNPEARAEMTKLQLTHPTENEKKWNRK